MRSYTYTKIAFAMMCTKSLLLLLFPTLLISTLFTLSEASWFEHQQILQFHGDEGEYGALLWGERRFLLGENNADNLSLVLAAKRTDRKDPSDHFKHYKGGWNFSNNHYIYSVGFTAASLFFIAGVWFVGFGIFLFIAALYYCCCRRQHYGYSPTAYALSLILVVFFTISAVVGCIVLYTGQDKFHDTTSDTLQYVVDEATFTVDKLMNVSEYLGSAKSIGVDEFFLPSAVQTSIQKVGTQINASAAALHQKTQDNRKSIRDVLHSMRLFLIIIAAVMLLLSFLGFVFSVFGLQVLVYILVGMGWILVTATFILCGIFLVFHNVAGDTCVAMEEWVQNPTARTALDDILPCVDKATAQDTLSESKDVTSQLVGMVNTFITNVSNRNFPANFTPPPSIVGTIYYNQSGPPVPNLCNPDMPCSKDEVEMINAGQEWKKYICQVSETGICTSVGRLTLKLYNEMMSAVNVSYALNQYGPFLVELQDCSFVRVTFSNICQDHCPELRLYSKQIYIGLTLSSAAIMLSLIFWVLYARERSHRVHTKQQQQQQQQFTLLREGSTHDVSQSDHRKADASTEIKNL